ncbi:hypothetical protein Airi02_069240 [Actinoallomurus iriomotensis]|uniref:Uncharacterized protein n=1 Tax=Actinoallomurus iriomotensis TaxID=478107 RepID=A0A9W6S5Z9_9ACTN|nr:hypothetical protein Airi02_069240 [Actinoallomurus iriomotensis]
MVRLLRVDRRAVLQLAGTGHGRARAPVRRRSNALKLAGRRDQSEPSQREPGIPQDEAPARFQWSDRGRDTSCPGEEDEFEQQRASEQDGTDQPAENHHPAAQPAGGPPTSKPDAERRSGQEYQGHTPQPEQDERIWSAGCEVGSG